MNAEMIDRLKRAFAGLVDRQGEVADLFYERVFALDPSLKPLFLATDMELQGAKLFSTLSFLINQADKPSTLGPTLDALAVRHVRYGVQDKHYAIVGKALAQTLALMLGRKFDPDMRAAWDEIYATISARMIEAARRDMPSFADSRV